MAARAHLIGIRIDGAERWQSMMLWLAWRVVFSRLPQRLLELEYSETYHFEREGLTFLSLNVLLSDNCLDNVIQGAELVAVHKGRYYKRDDGLALGPGPFVAAIEYATGAKVFC